MTKAIGFVALFTLISLNIQAQKIATWKGGTPGRPTEWNCPSNWKEGRVPDEFSKVIIPDVSTATFSYPQISKGTVEVASLQSAPNAQLLIRGNARLIALDDLSQQPKSGSIRYAETAEKADSALSCAQHQ